MILAISILFGGLLGFAFVFFLERKRWSIPQARLRHGIYRRPRPTRIDPKPGDWMLVLPPQRKKTNNPE